VEKNPAAKLKGLREPRRTVVALTKGEVYQIINHRLPYRTAKKRLWERDHILMMMIAATGIRPNEVAHLTWDCINFEEQYVWVKPDFGKGQKERRVVLINELASHLFHKWKKEQPNGSDPLFPDIFHPGKAITARTVNQIFKRLLKDCGITRFEPRYQRVYLLRKSYITHLIKDGVSIESVSSLAGHANASTTWRYYVEASTFDEIKDEVMDKFYLNHTPKSNELEEYQKGLVARQGYVIKSKLG
jgi:integrase/recombinase XerD